MASTLNIAVILSAVDKMSGVFDSATNKSIAKLDRLREASKTNLLNGTGAIAAGLGLAMSLKPAVDAYEELEAAQANLESRVMRNGGFVDAQVLANLNAEAQKLGNQLPGTTADLSNMFTVMLENNVAAERITNGLGKATAFFAVNTKMAYGDAAQFVARLSTSLGIADKDAMKFLDTINRTKQLGVDAQEMGLAFGRSAGSMKLLGIQGAEAFKKMAAIQSVLIKTIGSGESAGTSLNKVLLEITNTDKINAANDALRQYGINLSFVDKNGEFKGVDNMLMQFSKLDKLNNNQKQGFLKALTGLDGTDLTTTITLMRMASKNGQEFISVMKQMGEKASLDDQVKRQLSTFKALREAAEGTFTNMLATFGEAIGPELKYVADMFIKITEHIQKFSKEHPKIMKFIGMFIAFSSAILLVGGALLVVKGLLAGLAVLSLASPIGWIAALAGGAALLITNWETVGPWFENMWMGIVADMEGNIAYILNLLEPFRSLSTEDILSGKFSKSIENLNPNKAYEGAYQESMFNQSFNKSEAKSNGYGQGQSILFSPTVVIQGNADKSVVTQALGAAQISFEAQMKEARRNEMRKGFDGKSIWNWDLASHQR